MKRCTKCGIEKALANFYKNNGQCKPCYLAAYAEQRAAYRANNKQKEALAKVTYYLANKEKFAFRTAKRRAIKLKATPAWSDTIRVQAYYDVANFFNEVNGYIKYHVDHIIPLQGKKVSGLHVHNNLQIIPAIENYRKNNRFEIQS